MNSEFFKPDVNQQHKFAVAVPAGGIMVMIETYEKREELKAGYQRWRQYSSQHGITRPYPIQLLDKSGKCMILDDMLQEATN